MTSSSFVVSDNASFSSDVKDHVVNGEPCTRFEYYVKQLHNEKHKQDYHCYIVFNDGDICLTKGGVLFGHRGIKTLPEWKPLVKTKEECQHIVLPCVGTKDSFAGYTYAYTDELGAYKLRNFIWMRLNGY